MQLIYSNALEVSVKKLNNYVPNCSNHYLRYNSYLLWMSFVQLEYKIIYYKVLNQNLKDDIVAIFGRSNSGILILKELMNLPVGQRPKKLYLFYKGEIKWYE